MLTSRAFLDKVKLKVPGQTVLLEEVAAKPGSGEKLCALLSAWLLPAGLLERSLGRDGPRAVPARSADEQARVLGTPPPLGIRGDCCEPGRLAVRLIAATGKSETPWTTWRR